MASEWSGLLAQHLIPYKFQDVTLLHRALIAGDSNSDDREGHRGMAQVGDALMSFVLMSEGFDRGIPRDVQEHVNSELTSKRKCSTLARTLSLDKMVRISERQQDKGPQPKVLKNTLAAIVAAVWLDSRNYQAVVQVMASLGLINFHEPSVPSQHQRREDLMLSPSREFECLDTGPAELGAIMVDANLDVFLEADILGPDWTSSTFRDSIFDDCIDSEPSQNPAPLGDETESRLIADEAVYRCGDPRTLEGIVSTVDPSMLRVGTDAEWSSSSTTQNAPISDSEIMVQDADKNSSDTENVDLSPIAGQTPKRQRMAGSSQETSHGPLKPKIASPTCLTFKMYLSREAEKLNDRPELFTLYYGHMHQYQEALSSYHKDFAKIAVGIGDSSAIVLLKQAIESARSPPNEGWLHIGRPMSPKQRLQAIRNLDVCMAHLRLARWLHIYQLHERLSRDVGGKDMDNFVTITSAEFCQSPNEAGTMPRRGNPRNIEQAVIARRMAGDAVVDGNKDENLKGRSPMKRLRRVARRLHQIVNRWGLGVLALLLCTTITDDLIMTGTDSAFSDFIQVVERFEGAKLHAVSESVAVAVQLFMEDSAACPDLPIEHIDGDDLKLLPRLSKEMQALFTF